MTFRGWQVLVVCVVCSFLAAASSMVYANRVARESERKWCSVVVTITDAQREVPPQTASGEKFAADLAQLRRELGCP